MSIYDAAMAYARTRTPLIVIAGREYGTGSSRDWAAKGPRLLGVRAVIARSFERIHRSNLIGMGVLPCEFDRPRDADALALTGDESFDLLDIDTGVTARQHARLRVRRADGAAHDIPVRVRADTPIEARYLDHGGILPFMLGRMLEERAHAA
jgi:aconitate hydratase